MKTFMRVAAIAALAWFLAGAASARDIVVGQVVDYAGKYGEASRDFVAGAKVYFDSVNSRGGLNGGKIVHVVLDGGAGSVPVRAKTRELLDEKKVDVLFGYVGEEAVDAASQEPELRNASIAMVGPLAGRDTPDVTRRSVFYVRPRYEAEVLQIVNHFRALQITRFVVVRTRSPADAWIGELVSQALAQHQIKPQGVHTLSNDAGGTEADVKAVTAMQGQAVIVAADTIPAAEFIKRFRPLDPGAMIVGLSLVNHRVMFEMLGPKIAHGIMITQVVPNPLPAETPILKEHLDAIRTFRDEPPSHLTLEGFIAAKTLVEGLRRAGRTPTRETIVSAFQKTGRLDLNGVTVDFSTDGRLASRYVDIAMIRRNGSLLQ